MSRKLAGRLTVKDLNSIFIKAKKKKMYGDLVEFQNIIQQVQSMDENIRLDWDAGVIEEWARFIKNGTGIVCMMNIRIGVVFVRVKSLSKEILEIFKELFVVYVDDYESEEWFIDLSLLQSTTPEIDWNASSDAVNTEKMSLNDLYFATIM